MILDVIRLNIMSRFSIKSLFIVVGLAAVSIWVLNSMVTVIPPKSLTITAIGETHYRIYLFAESNGTLPARLADLPKRHGYTNRIENAWGKPLLYEIDDSGVITLGSLGRDGKVGGEGDDEDIFRKYRTRDEESGRFIASDYLWVVHGEIHDPSGG